MIKGRRDLTEERIAFSAQDPYLQKAELFLLFAVLSLGVLARIIYISQPFVDAWSWRQADVAMISENFYLHGFNIFYPQINWAGNSPGYVGTEFPLVPFIVSLLYLVFGVQDWIGRSVSVLFFAFSVPFFYLFVRKISGERSAIFAVGVYALAPLGIFAGRSFMPDMASLCFSIIALYLFTEWLHQKRVSLFAVACVAVSVAILVKLPAILIGLPLVYLSWQAYGAKCVLRRELWIFAASSLFLPAVWYFHAYLISVYYFPHHMFGSQGIAIESLGVYEKIWQEAATSSLTPLVSTTMVFGIFAPSSEKYGRVFHWWLAAILLFALLAGQGHYRHAWYLLPLVPVAAAFAGRAFDLALARITPTYSKITATVISIIFFSSLSYISFGYVEPLYTAWGMGSFDAGTEINRIAPPQALVIVADGGDPTCLYYSRRKGWHFLEIFGNVPADDQQAITELEKLRKQGGRYLVFSRYTMWWLDYYKDFRRYVDSGYQRVQQTPDFIIFDLVKAESAKRQLVPEPISSPIRGLPPGVEEKEPTALGSSRL